MKSHTEYLVFETKKRREMVWRILLEAPSTQLLTFCAVLWRFCTNIERGLQVGRQHTMARRTTHRTRFGLQGNLCSTACTKCGHVLVLPLVFSFG